MFSFFCDFLGSHTTPSQLTTASFGVSVATQDGFVSAEAFAEELAGKSQVGPVGTQSGPFWDLG